MTLKKMCKILYKSIAVLFAVMVIAFVSIKIYVFVSSPTYELKDELYGYHYGRDYLGHVGYGQFQLWRCHYSNTLMFATDPITARDILQGEYDYYFDDDQNLYYYAADGYAVVYAQANIAKVLIVDPPPELALGEKPRLVGYRRAESNYRIKKLEGEEFKNILYLNSFDEFTEHEQKQLNKLKKRVNIENAVHHFIRKLFGFSE